MTLRWGWVVQANHSSKGAWIKLGRGPLPIVKTNMTTCHSSKGEAGEGLRRRRGRPQRTTLVWAQIGLMIRTFGTKLRVEVRGKEGGIESKGQFTTSLNRNLRRRLLTSSMISSTLVIKHTMQPEMTLKELITKLTLRLGSWRRSTDVTKKLRSIREFHARLVTVGEQTHQSSQEFVLSAVAEGP